MSNALARTNDLIGGAITSTDLKAQIQLIQQTMKDSMFENTHFGKVPGTPKPSLWKAGAEKLCLVFHIAPHYRTEDLSAGDVARYRVTCLGKSQVTGQELGEGVGECSSDEAKYKWRSPVCDEEFNETDDGRKRKKWSKGGGKPYQQKQVRTDSADQANTVLKMAAKRAHIAMVLNVLAASDIFTQDLEDIDPDQLPVNEIDTNARRPAAKQANKPATSAPQSTGGHGKITDGQRRLIFAKLNDAGMSAETLCKQFQLESLNDLPMASMNAALDFIAEGAAGSTDESAGE